MRDELNKTNIECIIVEYYNLAGPFHSASVCQLITEEADFMALDSLA